MTLVFPCYSHKELTCETSWWLAGLKQRSQFLRVRVSCSWGCLAGIHRPCLCATSSLSGTGGFQLTWVSPRSLLLADSKMSSLAITPWKDVFGNQTLWVIPACPLPRQYNVTDSTMSCKLVLPVASRRKAPNTSHSVKQHSSSWRRTSQKFRAKASLILYMHR